MGWESLIIILRLVQYAGAAILFGFASFLLYNPGLTTGRSSARQLLIWAGVALLVAAPLQFIIQAANLTGSPITAVDLPTLKAALLEMSFGKSSLARTVLAIVSVLNLLSPDSQPLFWRTMLFGMAICASFAWMGHGAATEGGYGWLHLTADILHNLAAAGWIGALIAFWMLTRPRYTEPIPVVDTYRSLHAFSRIGTLFVAVIVVTGFVNSAFLVGFDPTAAAKTQYGRILALKLISFCIMLILAVANRFRYVPALGQELTQNGPRLAFSRLRTSLMAENLTGLAILFLVSWLGTLPPTIASQ